MAEIVQTIWALIGRALDLLLALGDFLGTSSVSLPVSAFIGVSIVAFLMGLILGRMSRRAGSEVENSQRGREDRIVLDLEKLTPLGLSAEEEAEATVMDISHLRPEETAGETVPGELGGARHPGIAPQR
jgi:hypothetical protein